MSSLPQLTPRTSPHPRMNLPVKPLATKAEKYVKLMKFDLHVLKRPDIRNALKTTEWLQRVTRQLDAKLERLEKKGKISFERLSAVQEAFDEIIRLNHSYAPILSQIKDAYDEYLLFKLSQQGRAALLHVPGPPLPTNQYKMSPDLLKLKKQVHELEVKSRVLLCENIRLREELYRSTMSFDEELALLHKEGNEAVAFEMMRRGMLTPEAADYATKVDHLHRQIADKRDAINEEVLKRDGQVHLTVCNNLEQCLREVELETQKLQRLKKQLKKDINKSEQQLMTALKERGLKLSSDLSTILGLNQLSS